MSIPLFAGLLCLVLSVEAQGSGSKAAAQQTEKIIEAIFKKNFDGLSSILSKPNVDTNQPDTKGRLPIIEAAKTGDVKYVDAVIQFAALVKSKDMSTGITALHIAVQKGYTEITRLLLAYGADPLAADKSGKAPRDFANSKDIQSLLALYEKQGPLAFEDSPGTWIQVSGKDEGLPPYWFNVRTSDSRWNTPPSAAWHRVEVGGAAAKFVNAVTGQEVTVTPPALAWRKIKFGGREMWYNWVANTTQLEKPQEMPEKIAAEAELMMNTRWYNVKTHEYSWEDPLLRTPWRTVTDADTAKTFFYNVLTAESVWDTPPELSWVEEKSDAHGGLPYYFNKRTGESMWEKPEHMSWNKDDSDL